ncbi:hypothetical protein QBC34DRAFT_378805 [Podospora aff. communis PSN243]|uniref:Peptidase S8/S53 domain-containing protein n=1 Tax=Podospora aff. communis PSN243 TaxID=3040156 RepID=A0AAV9GTQ3_9PEZI|nr:hypothetical protein QBC34DRAFT_378805 [Podospora aff. communis PSN243]
MLQRAHSLGLYALILILLSHFSTAILLRETNKCAPGEYWCQDRCGSDAYGNTCCTTPDGQHNLCGAGTICCHFGCCPSGSVCNLVGGCDTPLGAIAPVQISKSPSSCPSQPVVTSTTWATYQWPDIGFLYATTTTTLTKCNDTIIGMPPPTIRPTTADPSPPVNTGSVIIIGGTATITVPVVTGTSPVTLSTDSHTFTAFPPSSAPSSAPSSPTAATTVFTTTGTDGQTIISSGSHIVIGTNTVTVPQVTAPSTLVTGGAAFTFFPPSPSSPSSALSFPPSFPSPPGPGSGTPGMTTTLPNSELFTFPPVTAPTTIVTGGTTVTALPPPPSPPPDQPPSAPTPSIVTLPENGEIFTLPSVTTPTTIVTGGTTLTVLPPAPTSLPPGTPETPLPSPPSTPSVVTLPENGELFTLPTVTAPTTFTRGGTTLTVLPPTPTVTGTATSTIPGSVITPISGTGIFTLPTFITAPTTITQGTDTITLFPPITPPVITGTGFLALPSNTVVDGTTYTYPCNTGTASSTVTLGRETIVLAPTGQLACFPSVTTIDGTTHTLPCATGSTASTVTFGRETIVLSPTRQLACFASVTVIDGTTHTLPCATGSTASTVTLGRDTLVLEPSRQLACLTGGPVPLPTWTPTGSVTTISGSAFTYPCVTAVTTVTFVQQILTIAPGWPCAGTLTGSPPPSATETDSLTTFSTWPPDKTVSFISTTVEEQSQETDGGSKSTCKLYFFGICIKWGSIEIGGIDWPSLPPGVYPPCLDPGSCPPFKLPPGVHFTGTWPPWPSITIGPDHLLTFPAEPTGSACSSTQTGTFSLDSTSYIVATTDQTTRTISSSTTSTSVTWTACAATNTATSTAATSTAACALLPTGSNQPQPLEPRQTADPPEPGSIDPSTVDFTCERPSNTTYIIYIKTTQWNNETAVSEVEDLLERRKSQNSREYDRVADPSHVWVFNAHNMHVDVAKVFATLLAVDGMPGEDFELDINEHRAVPERSTGWEENGSRALNVSAQPKAVFGPALPLDRRAVHNVNHGQAWHLSQLSLPVNAWWRYWRPEDNVQLPTPYVRPVYEQGRAVGETFHGYWDDSYGRGQWVYIWEHDIYRGHTEFANNPPQEWIGSARESPPSWTGSAAGGHGTIVASMAVGRTVGVAKNANWLLIKGTRHASRFLETLAHVKTHVRHNNAIGKAVVSMAFSWDRAAWGFTADPEMWLNRVALFLNEMQDNEQVVFVAAAASGEGGRVGREAEADQLLEYPPHFAVSNIPGHRVHNMIIVGASTRDGRRDYAQARHPGITIYAPGRDVTVAQYWGPNEYSQESGSSLSTGMVTGLVAYLRGFYPDALASPLLVKHNIMTLYGRVFNPQIYDAIMLGKYAAVPVPPPEHVRVAWNGQCQPNPNAAAGNARARRGNKGLLRRQDQTDEGPACPALPLSPGGDTTIASETSQATVTSASSGLDCLFTATTTNSAGSVSSFCTTPPSSLFPTIPLVTPGPTSFTTPPGSSCAATTTTGTCNLGVPPGVTACVQGVSCVSWVATSARPTPTWSPPSPTGGFWLAEIVWTDDPTKPADRSRVRYRSVLALPDDHPACDLHRGGRSNVFSYVVGSDPADLAWGLDSAPPRIDEPLSPVRNGIFTLSKAVRREGPATHPPCNAENDQDKIGFDTLQRDGRTWDQWLEFGTYRYSRQGTGEDHVTGYCEYDPGEYCGPWGPGYRYRRLWHCMAENDPGWCNGFWAV